MPWTETRVMDQKIQLLNAWMDGHSITELADHFGISRKTVYKWVGRYEAEGVTGLTERSRAPHHCPGKVDEAVTRHIIETKLAHRSFGPKKVMDLLRREQPEVVWPADSTAGELLKRAGLVSKRRVKRCYPADPQSFDLAEAGNNAIWSVDYKGQYPLASKGWCYPLTITDNASRFLLGCEGLTSTRYELARPVFERVFRAFGLPEAILSDNGAPFASRSAGGLSRLSMWWVQLGIRVHRIRPGKPTQNARHERMHGSLNRAIGRQLRGAGLARQLSLLSAYQDEYNQQRSHEGLGRRTPASVYRRSLRHYSGVLPCMEYDVGQLVRQVRHNGEIKLAGQRVYISELLAGQPVALRTVGNDREEVRFGAHLLGYIDQRSMKLESACHWHDDRLTK